MESHVSKTAKRGAPRLITWATRQARFYDFNVWTERKRIEKLRYMHPKPVKRELVESPEMWHWSSFRNYAFGERGLVKVTDWQVLTMKIRRPPEPTSRKPRDVGHPLT